MSAMTPEVDLDLAGQQFVYVVCSVLQCRPLQLQPKVARIRVRNNLLTVR